MSKHRRTSRWLAGAFALALAFAPLGTSQAGNGQGHVTLFTSFIGLYGSGNVYFWTETSTDVPGCVAAYNRDGKSHRFVFNLNSEEGKAYFQVLMSAKLLGKRLFIFGSGTCDIATDSESVASMRFLD
jgi:hypothetical protein